jgi:E3 ubiquitin-protein ligase RGLG
MIVYLFLRSQCINVVIEGKISFNNRSLHAIGDTPNPYEKAISIIGKTLAPFDDDNLIPCFGFGDGKTY